MRADWIILVCLYFLPVVLANGDENETVFVPTHEWQVVKKGTPMPDGVHVRHNLQTGVTEAKLLNSQSKKEKTDDSTNRSHSKSLTLHPDKAVVHEDENKVEIKERPDPLSYPIDELKARLKKIKEEEIQSIPEAEDEEAARERVKRKFRDYQTLKEELGELEINITTDAELITSFLQKFEPYRNGIIMGTLTEVKIEDVLTILDELGHLVSYIDNAKVFTDMQGMTKVVSPCLNGTNNDIKAEALRLLGAAVQSNPKVQAKALESDFVQKILHILSVNTKVEVKSRCLFALGALIRQFPVAQRVWINHGGLEIFGKILIDGQWPIQIKVMKLINDLLIERQQIHEITDTEQRQQRIEAYATAPIEWRLFAHGYCTHLSNLLTKTFNQVVGTDFASENSDFFEILSESMLNTATICTRVYATDKKSLLPVIDQLIEFYKRLDSANDVEEFDIFKNIIQIMEKLQTTISEIPHDEL